jgi:cyclophilin family peptidyl-prolyl cis-trans isomerase
MMKHLPKSLLSLLALVLLPVLPVHSQPAVTPAPEETAAPTLPTITIVLNGRSTDIPVESTTNPLVLLQTNRGDMVFELFPEEAPSTVNHFLSLADGSKPFLDPVTRQQVMRPFYDGLGFHRIVNGFIIQGGSPDGSPGGNPGIVIADEINALSLGLDRMTVLDSEGAPHPILGIRSEEDFRSRVLEPLYRSMGIADAATLRQRTGQVRERLQTLSVKDLYELEGYRYTQRVRSRPPVSGALGMANHGPGTTGSQFFITLTETDWLTGRYNFFGRIRAGDNVLQTLARSRVDDNDRPVEAITIFSVTRIRTETL